MSTSGSREAREGAAATGGAPRWRRRDDVLERRSLDAVLLLPPGADDPLVVAGSGPAVWAALAEPGTVGELARRLAAAFGADPAVVAADLEPLLERLAAVAAIEPVDDGPRDDARDDAGDGPGGDPGADPGEPPGE